MIELDGMFIREDGVLIVHDQARLEELFLKEVPLDTIRVLGDLEDVVKFNQLSENSLQFYDETEEYTLDFGWKIPDQYSTIELREFFLKKLETVTDDPDRALTRVENELVEVRQRNLTKLFQTIIYVVDMFRQHHIVWGVGRGSSCASYLLYLTGIHLVNPIKYNIPASEFFHS